MSFDVDKHLRIPFINVYFSFVLSQMTERNDTCELGRRFRTITCVDNGGEEIEERLCSQSQEGKL